jgi:aldehyde:ferredoxin oxidoreductase
MQPFRWNINALLCLNPPPTAQFHFRTFQYTHNAGSEPISFPGPHFKKDNNISLSLTLGDEPLSNAYMGKILDIDLSTGRLQEESLNMDWARQFLGGAGLATRYLYDLIPAGIDPLGSDNILIMMSGPLTGTASASASRYSVVAKSPQTGIWGHANSGGDFGPMLKRAGYDGIIFRGVSPSPVYLKINDGQAELCQASELWGKEVPQTESLIKDIVGPAVTIASIGPAGENLVRYAAIMNNTHRAAGRCGMGAVMGSKKLKAVVCGGKQRIHLSDRDSFNEAAKRQIALMDESLMKIGFDTFGTNMLADMVNVRGGYPTHNWKQSMFEDIEEVNAQAMTDKILVEGVNCFACPVTCGRGTEIRTGKWKGHSGEGPEYETTNTLGAMCGISDLNAIAMANYRCNELGLDTISTGATIAFAMECFEKGILTEEQSGGISLEFGDADVVVQLIDHIAHREGLGDLLAEGTLRMSRQLGGGSEHFAMQVKGLELPAYDPRAAKITGLGYVTANRGGDHITGYIQGPTFIDIPFLVVEESNIRDPFQANPEEVKVLVDMENALTVFDALGGCKFMGVLLDAQEMVDLISSATGWDFSVEEFRQVGERTYNLMRMFCAREGLDRNSDVLPGRLTDEPLPSGPAEGMVIDNDTLETLKNAYYVLRGWDAERAIPTAETMDHLGLGAFTTDFW